MTTPLNKKVSRRTETTRRDRGKSRRYIVSLHPGDLIGFRLEKCRSEEFIPVGVAYEMAIRLRLAKERAEKSAGRKKLVKRGKL
jgi:hypothetical protein